MTRQDVIKKSREVATHEKVVAEYNKINPLPVGYKLKMSDDWCAAYVTVVLHLCKYDKLNECSVPRMIAKAKALKIWITSYYKPQPGDLVVYDWDSVKDGDHIGIITDIDNSGYITVREGNKNNSIGLRVIKYSDSCITGYITPKYKKEVAEASDTYKTIDDIVMAILAGDFGNGEERKEKLYEYFQKKVNDKLSR